MKILGRGLRLSYDYLGMVLAGSTLWFFVGLVPAALAGVAAVRFPSLFTLATAAFVVVLLTVPAFTALVAVSRSLARGEEVPLAGFWYAFRSYFARSAGIAAAGGLVMVILVLDLAFFLQAPSVWVRAVAGAWVWLIVYGAAVVTVAPAVLVWMGRGPLVTLKQAALIVLDNAVVSAVLMAALAVLGAASVVLGAPLLLLFGQMSAFLLSSAMEAILERYRLLQEDSGKAGEGL